MRPREGIDRLLICGLPPEKSVQQVVMEGSSTDDGLRKNLTRLVLKTDSGHREAEIWSSDPAERRIATKHDLTGTRYLEVVFLLDSSDSLNIG